MVVVVVVLVVNVNFLVALFDEAYFSIGLVVAHKSDFSSAIFILSDVSVTNGDTLSLH
jgi:hypothetical protein